MNLQIFNDLSSDAVMRYYEDTFLNVKVNPESPFQYLRFKAIYDRSAGHYLLNMRDSVRSLVIDLSKSVIDFTLPQYGYYQFGDDAILFHRTPLRQYKKALTKESFGFTGLKQLYLNHLLPNMSQHITKNFQCPDIWSPKKLNELFLTPKEKLSVENKINIIFKRKKFAYALNRNFALSQPIKEGKFPYLWFLSSNIGFMQTPKHVILNSSEFRQEVIDFFPPNTTIE